MERLGYTRNTQKLIYWLIYDFANFWQGNEAGYSPNTIETAYAKDILKSEFVREYDGFDYIKEPAKQLTNAIYNKDNYTCDELFDEVVRCMQSMALEKYGFSLKLCALTQKQANDFVKFLFDLALKINVPLRTEIIELLKEQHQRDYIFTDLKYRCCAICGKAGADLEHFDNVARIGGYKFDTGTKLRLLPLCREHHGEAHYIGKTQFKNKYKIQGILLSEEEVIKLFPVYKNQFKALREKIKEKSKESS